MGKKRIEEVFKTATPYEAVPEIIVCNQVINEGIEMANHFVLL